jgi:hypothetical protein
MRTEAWSEYLGKWRCHIQSVEHLEDQECLQVELPSGEPLRLSTVDLLIKIACFEKKKSIFSVLKGAE